MNTNISYIYKDKDRKIKTIFCTIKGELTADQEEEIFLCLEGAEYFVPLQVGLPEKRAAHDKPCLDNGWAVWQEFYLTKSEPTIPLTVDELLNNFRSAKMNWCASKNRDPDTSATCDIEVNSELQFIVEYAKKRREKTGRVSLQKIRCLWVAFCLHNNVKPYSNEYHSYIVSLWQNSGISSQISFESFEDILSELLC